MRKAALVFLSLMIVFFCFPKEVWAISSPNLSSPQTASNVSKESLSLVWSWSGTCVSSGSCYLVQVNDQPDFSSPYREHYTNRTSYNPQLTNGIWYWRVKAKDTNNTWSPWSEVWNFTVDQNGILPPPVVQVGEPILNEFLPQPETGGKEWVEIKNKGTAVADLSGWKVDDQEGGSTPQVLPNNTLIQPGGFLVVTFQSPKLNDLADSVRLLKPDDSVVESYTYNQTIRGQSWSKDTNGNWFLTAAITPGAENSLPPVANTTTANPPTQKATTKQTTSNTADTPTAEISNRLPKVLATSEAKIATVSASFNDKKTESPLTLPLVILGSLFVIGSGGFLIKKKMKSGQPENSDQPL